MPRYLTFSRDLLPLLQFKFQICLQTFFLPSRFSRAAARTAQFRFPSDLVVESFQAPSLSYENLSTRFSAVEEVTERLPELLHAVTRVIEQRQRQKISPHALYLFLGFLQSLIIFPPTILFSTIRIDNLS